MNLNRITCIHNDNAHFSTLRRKFCTIRGIYVQFQPFILISAYFYLPNVKQIHQIIGICFYVGFALVSDEMMGEQEARIIPIAALMVYWWMTEAVPLAVTSLLPLVLFPISGAMGMKETAAAYSNPIVYLFFGGFMLALAMEKHQLHKRIALNIISRTGSTAPRIILGFMLATALVSMWISNTATTVMMLPIATSIIALVGKGLDKKTYRIFAVSLLIAIAYSANIGGIATLVGTPPNLVMAAYLNEMHGFDVEFSTWMMFGFPLSMLLLFICWIIITKVVFKSKGIKIDGVEELVADEKDKLGTMDRAEKLTLLVFVITALLWIFRSLIQKIDGLEMLNDTIIAIMAAIALFLIPSGQGKDKFLLEWKDTQRLPWGILLLFGGGLSLAAALQAAGILDSIGAYFVTLDNLDIVLLMVFFAATSLFLTEMMSNVALVTVFVPVVAAAATALGQDILHFIIPVTIAASCAFMMPMSTPPNAVVYATGDIKVMDMVRTGFIMNVLALTIISLFGWLILPSIF